MNDRIYDNLRFYFSYVADNLVECERASDTELVIKLKDGSSVLYDDSNKTIRNLPRNSKWMTEIECRKEFGMRLRKILLMNKMNQKDLSELTGISQVLLSKYITGKITPSFYNVDKICKALGCSTEELRYVR